MTEITQQQLDVLTQWDTPTICNGLELIVPERRSRGFTTTQMACFDTALKPIAGFARTATISAREAQRGDPAQLREHRAKYYRYVAEGGAAPAIVVIQDLDADPGIGAFWGEVNTAIHKGLGALGLVTNGSIRDLDACAPGFQMLAGKVGPSHAHVHVVDFGSEVNVFGMVTHHDDVVHADRHGAVVIPRDAVARLPEAIDLLTRREAVILDAARADGFNIEKLEKAMAGAADIH